MPKYRVKVTSEVPRIFVADLVIEAENYEAAYLGVQVRYNKDEIPWDNDFMEYDRAELADVTIQEIQP